MRVLVTGATGFVGKRLVPRLREHGHEVVAVGSRDCDLTQPDSLSTFDRIRFDRIFHLAAWTQAGDFCLKHPGEQWIINQQINTNMLAWWQASQPQAKMIAMSSSCIYDPAVSLVEDNCFQGQPIESLFSYAMTKRMLYAGLISLNRQYGLDYLCVIPSTLYGPGYHLDGRRMHFIFDLIRKILRGKRFGDKVVLWGDGEQRRELVHVDDFAAVLVQLADSVSNDLVNVGAGEEFSIRHFADLICSIVGFDPDDILYDTSRYVGARSKCLVTDKLKRLLPHVRFTPLGEGLRSTIQWFEQNADTVLK